VEAVADRISMYAALFGRPELINEQLGRYLAVTAADIQNVARNVFREDNRVVLTYVPRQQEAAA
jgi:predicted Zn-dependent peptidase